MMAPTATTLFKLVEALGAQIQFVLLPEQAPQAGRRRNLVTLKVVAD